MADPRAYRIAWIVLALPVACEDPGPGPARNPPPPPARAARTASPWQPSDGSQLLAVPPASADPVLAAELSRAISQARATAGDARKRWLDRPDDRWAIKWAAATEAGGVEHVWVEPMRWSLFRIEGRLVSPPREPLACGRTLQEFVSFPTEELSDWIVTTETRREGGYTIKVLEDHFGQP